MEDEETKKILNRNTDLSYEAVTNYWIALVQMRFSVASIFCAAAAFLVGALYAESSWLTSNRVIIAALGFAVTLTVWLLELRTRSLISNLALLGREYEDARPQPRAGAFFALNNHQSREGILIPFFNIKLSHKNKIMRTFVNHTFGLNLLYAIFTGFWLYSLCAAIAVDAAAVPAEPTIPSATSEQIRAVPAHL